MILCKFRKSHPRINREGKESESVTKKVTFNEEFGNISNSIGVVTAPLMLIGVPLTAL